MLYLALSNTAIISALKPCRNCKKGFERGLAADLSREAASGAGSCLRPPPASGPEITNFLCVSKRTPDINQWGYTLGTVGGGMHLYTLVCDLPLNPEKKKKKKRTPALWLGMCKVPIPNCDGLLQFDCRRVRLFPADYHLDSKWQWQFIYPKKRMPGLHVCRFTGCSTHINYWILHMLRWLTVDTTFRLLVV